MEELQKIVECIDASMGEGPVSCLRNARLVTPPQEENLRPIYRWSWKPHLQLLTRMLG